MAPCAATDASGQDVLRRHSALIAVRKALARGWLAAMAMATALVGANAFAQPGLLATIEFADTNGADVSGAGLTGASIDLGFIDFSNSSSLIGCIGCAAFLSVGHAENLTFDFTRANSPGFDELVAHLTNGTDEVLATQFRTYGVFGGAGTGALESQWFGRLFSEDQAIDVIRLRLDSFDLQASPFGWSANYAGRWEIHSPIPEPSTALMLLAGIGMLGAALATSKPRRTR